MNKHKESINLIRYFMFIHNLRRDFFFMNKFMNTKFIKIP